MKGWWGDISASSSAPPAQLIAVVGIVGLLLWLPSYTGYTTAMETATVNLKILLFVLPLLLMFVAYYGRLVVPLPQVKQQFLGEAGGSPWGVGALVLLVLVLVSYHSNFKSMWSPLVWRNY